MKVKSCASINTLSKEEVLEQDNLDNYLMTTYRRYPITLERGAGCWVWDVEGRQYLDFAAGIATCSLGHANPLMIEAVTQQIQKLHQVSNLYHIPLQGKLAKWLVEHSCCDRVFFSNSGGEANETAIKLARKYAKTIHQIENPIIITAHNSFHGRTLATLTATGQGKYQKDFTPLVPGFYYVPYNNIAALDQAINDLNQDEPCIAAIMLEPLQGEGGVHPGDLSYFQYVRQRCDDLGILLVLDEIQTGIGRSGTFWGYQHLGVEPDILTVAKGLGGGIPIGATLCKEFCNVFGPGDHGSTFGGNPLACAVALTVGQTLLADNLLSNVQQRGEQLRNGLKQIGDRYPQYIQDLRGWGLLNGLILKPNSTLTPTDIVQATLNKGLLLITTNLHAIRFVPPLIVTAEEVSQALLVIERIFASLSST